MRQLRFVGSLKMLGSGNFVKPVGENNGGFASRIQELNLIESGIDLVSVRAQN